MTANGIPVAGERYLVDTNVLTALDNASHAQHQTVYDVVARLTKAEVILCIAPQNLIELWNVMTRPLESNGFGLSVAQAKTRLDRYEEAFTVLPDAPQVFEQWKRLALVHEVKGKQVHDTRLCAFALAYTVQNILTLNERDFRRFTSEGINVVTPPVLLALFVKADAGNEMVWVMTSIHGDFEQIPKRELAEGMVQIKVEGRKEGDILAWITPEVFGKIHDAPPSAEPLPEPMLEAIRFIISVLGEQVPGSFEEWERDFRRDEDPAQEILLWLRVADKYQKLTTQHALSKAAKSDYFQVLLRCTMVPREDVLSMVERKVISDDEVLRIIDEYYSKDAPRVKAKPKPNRAERRRKK
ncbi:hypothetical protein EON83_25895 [bacterium]|nr:MAG: hypothetical protein EON83_25895 [bacterium]